MFTGVASDRCSAANCVCKLKALAHFYPADYLSRKLTMCMYDVGVGLPSVVMAGSRMILGKCSRAQALLFLI